MSEDTFGFHNLIGVRVGEGVTNYTEARDAGGHPVTASHLILQQRIIWHKMSVVLRLRNLGLKEWLPKIISSLTGA